MLLREYLQTKHSLPRRKFTVLVDEGKIFVDGTPVESYKHEIRNNEKLIVKSDKYKLNEKIIISEKKSDSVIILFNKPKGCVVSKSDSHNETIYGLLPKKLHNYYYIGRLDKESHGLLLLTNDPKLVHQWEHPKFEIEKEYVVEIDKPLEEVDKKKILVGVEDDGEILRVHKVESMPRNGGGHKVVKSGNLYKIILKEGKKRHIRRMFRALGYRVWDLQRIREGDFTLGDLPIGEWEIASKTIHGNKK